MLADAEVLVLDAQASGATPEHGDLLELAWGFVDGGEVRGVEAHWIRPRTRRPVPWPVRRLLGWSEERLATAIDAETAWARLLATARPGMPAIIHWARFERPFLEALHGGAVPFEVRCLHAIAERLFEGLPRKNLRALAGHLGHSPELLRSARGHVEATAHVWRAVASRLEREGVTTWAELDVFLSRPVPTQRGRKVVFPYGAEKRRALPDAPGVYRMLRPNGDVVYVGKAASIRKRVAQHFSGRAQKTDALEMLTQVAEVSFTETQTALEAALLEVEEIHRLDPPYNVQLRVAGRRAWFASRDFDDVRDTPDAGHPVGPLPSRGAVSGLAAMKRLLEGHDADTALRAAALGVPPAFAPDRAAFEEAWRDFAPRVPLLDAARALHPWREDTGDDDGVEAWTPERLRRHLARVLAGEGLLVRRARLLCLLLDASVRFVEGGRERRLGDGPPRPRSLRSRQADFDARTYDRVRVLASELRRVHVEGGSVAISVGGHALPVAGVFAAT